MLQRRTKNTSCGSGVCVCVCVRVCVCVCVQEAVGDTLEELWISYNLIEKLRGIHVMRKLKVLYMSNNLVKEWGRFPCGDLRYCIVNICYDFSVCVCVCVRENCSIVKSNQTVEGSVWLLIQKGSFWLFI